MLEYGIAIAAAIAAADRARRREASSALWGMLTALVAGIAVMFGGLFAVIPWELEWSSRPRPWGRRRKAVPSCGKETKIDSLACIHCGKSPRSR